MLVEISKASASNYDDEGNPVPPIEHARRYEGLRTNYCTLPTLDQIRNYLPAAGWFFRAGTQNHRELDFGRCAMETPDSTWVIDIPSLEWAVANWGRLVVDVSTFADLKYTITIYDDYIE